MDTEIRIFQNALDFKEVKVRECMVPRKEISALDVTESINSLNKLFIETKLSKILIYRDSIDNIIGFVHSSEMFKKPAEIVQVLLPVSIVPEVMSANELLKQFTNQHRSVAVVVDEFGGSIGLVMLDDVLDQVVGKILDEFDDEETGFQKISEDEFLVEGWLPLHELADHVDDLDLENPSVSTVGGYLTSLLGKIPEPGETAEIEGFQAEVIRSDDRAVQEIRFTRILDATVDVVEEMSAGLSSTNEKVE